MNSCIAGTDPGSVNPGLAFLFQDALDQVIAEDLHPNGLWRNSPQSVAALRFTALGLTAGSSFISLKSLINGL